MNLGIHGISVPVASGKDAVSPSENQIQKIETLGVVPDFFDTLYAADDMTLLHSQFGTLFRQKMSASEKLNSAVELDIERHAESLVSDIRPIERVRELLQFLRQRFGDITDIWLILQALSSRHREWKLDPTLLTEARDLLEMEASDHQRQALWAGVNTHRLTQQYARLTQISPRQLRTWYRVWLSWDNEDAAAFWWALASEAEYSVLPKILHYIHRALRQDLNALYPSTQCDRLSELQIKIVSVSCFHSVVHNISCLCATSQKETENAEEGQFADRVVQFIQTALVTPEQFLLHLSLLPTPVQLREKAEFLRAIRENFQTLPDLFFQDNDIRVRLDNKILFAMSEFWRTHASGHPDVEC